MNGAGYLFSLKFYKIDEMKSSSGFSIKCKNIYHCFIFGQKNIF